MLCTSIIPGTVTDATVFVAAHPVAIVKLMIALPPAIPLMVPVLPTVTNDGAEDDHTPPLTVSIRVEVAPVHNEDGPDIAVGNGNTLTVVLTVHPGPSE